MDWGKSQNSGDETNTYQTPHKWLYIHYYEALNILFRMENFLRIFVYIILKNNYKEAWPNITIKTTEENDATIANLVSRRIKQAQGFGYLCYAINSPLMYLNSGELTRLMFDDKYWPIFKPYFKASKEIIKNKFLEIETVRNSLAHFRPIKKMI